MPAHQTPDASRRRALTIIAVAAVVVALAVVMALRMANAPGTARASLIGGPFALQDGDGKTISDQTLRGRPFLVYFGYTHCPDVCPTELARISDVLTEMGSQSIPALFITVDPERDTPKVMQDYVSGFNSRIIGLSGSPEAVAAAEKAYRVFARKGQALADGDYSMDHSSIVYLMDKTGAFLEAFNVERPTKELRKNWSSSCSPRDFGLRER